MRYSRRRRNEPYVRQQLSQRQSVILDDSLKEGESENPFSWSTFSPNLRRTIWANILLVLVALSFVITLQSWTSIVWTLVGAALMGTAYTFTARNRAKVTVMAYFAVVGGILVAIFPYVP
jgi:drug/metabolite transporter (DMT)-like permease